MDDEINMRDREDVFDPTQPWLSEPLWTDSGVNNVLLNTSESVRSEQNENMGGSFLNRNRTLSSVRSRGRDLTSPTLPSTVPISLADDGYQAMLEQGQRLLNTPLELHNVNVGRRNLHGPVQPSVTLISTGYEAVATLGRSLLQVPSIQSSQTNVVHSSLPNPVVSARSAISRDISSDAKKITHFYPGHLNPEVHEAGQSRDSLRRKVSTLDEGMASYSYGGARPRETASRKAADMSTGHFYEPAVSTVSVNSVPNIRQSVNQRPVIDYSSYNQPLHTGNNYFPCTQVQPELQSVYQRPPPQYPSVDRFKKPLVLPDKFDGSVGWQDYHAHFELCAELNYWSISQKASYLAVSLRGPAQELLGDMSPDMRQNYSILVETLQARFGSEGQNELFRAQLKSRRRKSNESLPELAQAIKRLIARGYPNANVALREILALDHFIDALLDSETRLRLKQNKPATLDECVRMAIELEAFQKAEEEKFSGKNKKFLRATQSDKNQTEQLLLNKVNNLEKKLELFLSQSKKEESKNVQSNVSDVSDKSNVKQNPQSGDVQTKKKFVPKDLSKVQCYKCKNYGHYKTECPENKDPPDKKDSQKTDGKKPPENQHQLN